MKLSRGRYEDACEFIRKNARSLNVKMFEYHFENGSREDVIAEIVKFQNDDGWFGHAIEADFRLAASSPIATSVGI